MHIIKAMIIAFSTYSKIPMPQFEWKEEDMRYSMCFFPWVGAVIGALVLVASAICLPLRNKVTPPLVITRKVAAPESVGRTVTGI